MGGETAWRSKNGYEATGMAAELPGVIGIDTNCFIYFLDDHRGPRAGWLEAHVFEPLVAHRRRAVTSTLSISELLVRPYAEKRPDRAAALRHALESLPGLSILAVTAEIADVAARLRSGSGLRLPDAIQLATARAGGAEAFLTNDRSLAGADPPLPVLVLDDLVGA